LTFVGIDRMTLKERITEDMKAAMRAKEAAKLGAIRLLLAAIKQKEVDERIELDDTAVLGIIDKLLKQRRDSVTQYEAAKPEDLAWPSASKSRNPLCLPTRKALQRGNRCRRRCCRRRHRRQTPADMGKLMTVLKPTGRQGRHGRYG
jgi:uncharacterized protein YqeY